MKKHVNLLGLIVLSAMAILLNSCGQENAMDSDLAVDEASDNWIFLHGYYNEYGRCNDTQDNDGDGASDSVDPDCHLSVGPLNDLSVAPFPIGHNFLPDVTAVPTTGPGFGGDFRDRLQLIRWLRFLTEPNGNVAGIDIDGLGVNPEVVPAPAPLAAKIHQGSDAWGNNNNIFGALIGALPIAPPEAGPEAELTPPLYPTALGIPGVGPGAFYRSFGPFGGIGSQGALRAARTGNPDN